MNDDYLWDRSGDADAEVARLEQLFAPLASRDPGTLAPLSLDSGRPPRAGWRGGLAVAALVCVSTIVGWSVQRGAPDDLEPWRVARVEGTPTLAAAPLSRHSRLPRGRWLETDSKSSAVVFVGRIGRLEVAPGSRLRLLQASPQDHRAELVRGTIEAQIWAPPGQFAVDTPSATAVDLGCAYTLTIDDRGVGELTVQAGWVGFEHDGRESFIPAGATGHTYPGRGPGTPAFDEAPAALRDAVRRLDVADTAAAQTGPLDVVLQSARREDGLTLWHLLDRVDPTLAPRVVDRLTALVPMPSGVTRDGVLAGDREMRDAWWEALGLGTADWWRTWRQRWPHERLR